MAGYNSGAASSSSVFTPGLSVLADPPIRYVDAAAMDYLLIEVAQTLRTSSAVATTRFKKLEKEMMDAGLLPQHAPSVPKKEVQRDSVGSVTSKIGHGTKGDGDLEDEDVQSRLEAIGVHVGSNITERLCRDRPRFSDTLDAIKFICKDLWVACWDKQIDNLRTNHRGVYVLQDNVFRPIAHISSPNGQGEALKCARLYTAMPSGIIKGALARLGFQVVVVPEISSLPSCTFQVKLPKGS